MRYLSRRRKRLLSRAFDVAKTDTAIGAKVQKVTKPKAMEKKKTGIQAHSIDEQIMTNRCHAKRRFNRNLRESNRRQQREEKGTAGGGRREKTKEVSLGPGLCAATCGRLKSNIGVHAGCSYAKNAGVPGEGKTREIRHQPTKRRGPRRRRGGREWKKELNGKRGDYPSVAAEGICLIA